jgi:hypothetical protein
MKNLLLTICILFTSAYSFSQDLLNKNIPEPEFVGQALIINSDDEMKVLESSRLQQDSDLKLLSIKTKYKTWLEISGCCSQTILNKSNTPIKFIIKAENNNTDPTTLYQFVKLEKEKTKRKLLTSTMSMKGVKSNQDGFITFYGKKYGSSSYLLSATIAEPGEYGLLIGSVMEASARSSMGLPSSLFTFTIQ